MSKPTTRQACGWCMVAGLACATGAAFVMQYGWRDALCAAGALLGLALLAAFFAAAMHLIGTGTEETNETEVK